MESITQKAQELIKGRGDGRISVDDMKYLLSLNYNSIENVKELLQIYKNFNLTDAAKEELYKHVFKLCDLYHTVKNKI